MVLAHGVDENGDGELDEDEVDETYVLCHGENGKDGKDGTDGEDGDDGETGAARKTAPTVPLFAMRMLVLPESFAKMVPKA